MPPAPVIQDNKGSNLLSHEENNQVFRLLGVRCQSLAMGIVQLYTTNPPHHLHWIKRSTGVLCFVKDNIRKNYFFRLFCLKKNALIWEHEIYNFMEYISQTPYLNSFEAEGCIVAFNFAHLGESLEMKQVVDSKLAMKRRKEEKRARNSQNMDEYQQKSLTIETPYKTKITDPAVKRAKRRRNITKADIGNPQEFRHVSHVGFDPNKGFEWNSEDVHLHEFFLKAGVSETQLRDTETRKFIYEFIAANGGPEAVLTEAKQQQTTKRPPPPIPSSNSANSGPPVPPRGTPRATHSRAAPPPPPNCTAPSRPPPKSPPPVYKISLPPSGNAPPPPPPPPPPLPVTDIPDAFDQIDDLEVPPPLPNSLPPNQTDPRSALMESIRSGATLKPVADRNCESGDAREDLLSEIRKGFQLKPATEREVKPVSPAFETGNDLACALARALAERNRVIHSEDDSTSDTESDNDDEWDA